jgi:hypothetical protein
MAVVLNMNAADTSSRLPEMSNIMRRRAVRCFLPRGLPHAFMITSESARLLIITAPTGFEQFVREAGIPVHEQAPTKWKFDLGRMLGPAEAAGVEILGPPPFGHPPA